MVPSWTETLLKCGTKVVGRTRYCIHPADQVKEIPVVGGTKDISWEKAAALKPDIILFDEEENPKAMADASPYPWVSSHVRGMEDIPRDLEKLARCLQNPEINNHVLRWKKILQTANKTKSLEGVPGIIEWVREPNPNHQLENFVYIIWHNPWMAVSRSTFIGSVFSHLGLKEKMIDFPEPYPKVRLEDFDPQKTLLLFSSEPFPFQKKKDLLTALPFCSALINGESYSWFGVRSLEFLESLSGVKSSVSRK